MLCILDFKARIDILAIFVLRIAAKEDRDPGVRQLAESAIKEIEFSSKDN